MIVFWSSINKRKFFSAVSKVVHSIQKIYFQNFIPVIILPKFFRGHLQNIVKILSSVILQKEMSALQILVNCNFNIYKRCIQKRKKIVPKNCSLIWLMFKSIFPQMFSSFFMHMFAPVFIFKFFLFFFCFEYKSVYITLGENQISNWSFCNFEFFKFKDIVIKKNYYHKILS